MEVNLKRRDGNNNTQFKTVDLSVLPAIGEKVIMVMEGERDEKIFKVLDVHHNLAKSHIDLILEYHGLASVITKEHIYM